MFGKLIDYEVKDNVIILNFEKKKGIVTLINEDILNLKEVKNDSFIVLMPEVDPYLDFSVQRLGEAVIIRTKKYKFEIGDNFKLRVYKDHKLISTETDLKFNDEVNKADLRILELEGHKSSHSDKEHKIMLNKVIKSDDFLYGLGDKTGFLNKRNYEYEMWNTDDPSVHADNYKALYKSIPFYITFNKDYCYGFFINNTYKQYYDMSYTFKNVVSIGFDKGCFNYYFIGGDSLKDVVSNYTFITGRTPLPQLFTLGYHQCRWSYASELELLEIARNFRRYKLPCDVLYCDIDYMERYKVFTYNKETFAHFPKMVKDLNDNGFKLVTIIDPGVKVEAGYDVYEEAIKNNFVATKDGKTYINAVWPGDAVYPSFINEKCRNWWGEKIKFLTDLGVSGIWNDMNEPASFRGPLPDDVIFSDGKNDHYHDEVHNVYGHYMSMATYEGLKKLTKKRPFVITRASFAGTQKYATVWTGDNHSIWAHLQMAIPMLLNLGLSGYSYSGTDVGGFSGNCTKELLCRWVEFGLFTPLFRNHSAMGTKHQEPWCFDDETLEIYKKALNLRYKLIPYLYDLYYEGSLNGLPILRPLVMEFSFDSNTYELNDEFMFGANILVSPVINQGVLKKMVYLPEGKWYDLETSKEYLGGYQIMDAPLEKILAFVKEGAIIPTYPLKEMIKDEDEVIFEVYPGEGSYLHYQDNGSDFKYQKGEYNLYEITHTDNKVKIKMLHEGYKRYRSIKLKYFDTVIEVSDFNEELVIE